MDTDSSVIAMEENHEASDPYLASMCFDSADDEDENATVLSSGRRMRKTDKVPYSDRMVGTDPTASDITCIEIFDEATLKQAELSALYAKVDVKFQKFKEKSSAIASKVQKSRQAAS